MSEDEILTIEGNAAGTPFSYDAAALIAEIRRLRQLTFSLSERIAAQQEGREVIPADTKPGTVVWSYDWGHAWQALLFALKGETAVIDAGDRFIVINPAKLFPTQKEAWLAMAREMKCQATLLQQAADGLFKKADETK